MVLTNTNINTLPFYSTLEEQWHKRRYANYNPIYTPATNLIPFQLICSNMEYTWIVDLYDEFGVKIKTITEGGIGISFYTTYHILWCMGRAVADLLEDGKKYYLYVKKGTVNPNEFYSDFFEANSLTSKMVQLTYYNITDVSFGDYSIMSNYQTVPFYFKSYLPSEIGKPKYVFENTIKTLQGTHYPMSMISSKEFNFPIRVTEIQMDALRLCAVFDKIRISQNGINYFAQKFEFSEPEWNDSGIATIDVSFTVDSIVHRISPSQPTRGDFNDDYNDDFFNL